MDDLPSKAKVREWWWGGDDLIVKTDDGTFCLRNAYWSGVNFGELEMDCSDECTIELNHRYRPSS